MVETDYGLNEVHNKNGGLNGRSEMFSPMQWPVTYQSSSKDSISWPNTLEENQDYFEVSDPLLNHKPEGDVSYPLIMSLEGFKLNDLMHNGQKDSWTIPKQHSESFKQNKGAGTLSFESVYSLTDLPKFDNSQSSTEMYSNESNNVEKLHENYNSTDPPFMHQNASFPYESKSDGYYLQPNMKLNLSNVEKPCVGLIPLINKAKTKNYYQLLVETLRTCLQDIELEELYNLLYNPTTYTAMDGAPVYDGKMKQLTTGPKLDGFKICSFILETFGLRKKVGISSLLNLVRNPQLEFVNLEEFRRTFLAVKIISDFIVEVDGVSLDNKAIPRASIYKAYCMICQNLPERFKLSSKSSRINKSIVVGVSQLGKLVKLVYPHLKVRRLGRRGSSRHHYVGIMWNTSLVDAEMIRKLELDDPVSILRNILNTEPKVVGLVEPKIPIQKIAEPILTPKTDFFQGFTNTLYRFVVGTSKLPISGCLPRDWKYFPGIVPKQSPWSRQIMSRSIDALRKYGIDMKPIVNCFHAEIFSNDVLNLFCAKFMQRINTLIKNKADDRGYMHLYLIILLLIFPVILATDKEVPYEDKVKLRETLNCFVNELKLKAETFPSSKVNYLHNFSNIIKKMINISDLSLSHIKTGLVQAIVQEIALDIQKPTSAHINLCHNPAIEEIFFRAVFTTANAFESEFFTDESENKDLDKTGVLTNIVRAFINYALKVTERLFKIPESTRDQDLNISTFDLPFQIFKILTRVLHQFCFSDPLLSKLLIQAIGYILLLVNNELQNVSFGEFGNRESELSSATFKTWWVYSTLSGEYMKILEEIVALSARLS